MTSSEDESLKMSGGQALFSLSSAVLLMMAGVRASLDEQTLVDSQIARLYAVYAALATCSKELTELAIEIDAPQGLAVTPGMVTSLSIYVFKEAIKSIPRTFENWPSF